MLARTQIKSILFDLDGTLLDTAPDLARAVNQLLVRRGKTPLSVEKIRDTITLGSAGILGLAFNIQKSHPSFHHLRHEFLEEYSNNISKLTVLFPEMNNVLKMLTDMGMNWGVVTNKPHDLAKKLLEETKLYHHCACLVGGMPTRKAKPDPESLVLACEMLELKPTQCVYVGDAQSDIVAAKQIHMPTIAAMYGYIAKDEKPETWAADYYIDKPMEIIEWLTRKGREAKRSL